MLFKFASFFKKSFSNISYMNDKHKKEKLRQVAPVLFVMGAGTVASTFASFRMLYLNDTQHTDYAHLEYQPFENDACILPRTKPRG